MQQNIAAFEHSKDAFKFLFWDRPIGQQSFLRARQWRCNAGLLGLVFELRQRHAGEGEQVIEAQRPTDLVDVLLLDRHAFHQQADHIAWHVIGDLEAHHLAPHAAPAQTLLQRIHEVVRFQFPQLQVRVAGDPEGVVGLHAHAWEQQAQVVGHHLLQGDGGVEQALLTSQLKGHLDEARQILLGHFHPRKLLLTGIRVPNQGSDVEAEVADEGKRVGRIHRQRRQHRKDGAAEVLVDPGALLIIELLVIEHLHPMLSQLGPQGVAVVLLLLLQQWPQLGLDRRQLLQRAEAIHAWGLDAGFHL